MNWFFVTFIDENEEADADRPGGAELASKGAGVHLHVKVDDIEEFRGDMVSKGMTPAGEPRKRRNGGRELLLRDPDGYNLVFFEKK